MATLHSQFGFPISPLYMQDCGSLWFSKVETTSNLLGAYDDEKLGHYYNHGY